jgi:aryl-alcohol dehydrogenase-like predicted oxidoreductase
MEYRRLGTTGLTVSRVGLGCGNFGGIGSAPEFFGQGESEQAAFLLMDRAVDVGINFFDTADAYGGGRSETCIGHWLRGKGSRVRELLLLSSKVFNPVGPGPNDRGLSRRQIFRQVDAIGTGLAPSDVWPQVVHHTCQAFRTGVVTGISSRFAPMDVVRSFVRLHS